MIKRVSSLVFLALLTLLLTSSNTIEEGKGHTIYIHEICKYDTDVILKKIEFEDEKTVVVLEFRQTSIMFEDSAYVFINTLDSLKTYTIQDLKTGKKYTAYHSNVGLTFDNPTYLKLGRVIDIRLEFPPLSPDLTRFTLSEKMEGGHWAFYNLNLDDYINNNANHLIYSKNEALRYLKKKDYTKAYRLIKKYIHSHPKDGNAHNIACAIAYADSDIKKAEKHITAALQLNPRNHTFHENMCVLQFSKNKIDLAIQYLDSAILYCPDQPNFYELRAAWNYEIENYKKAIADYDKLIRFHRYTKERGLMYYYRATAKIMIDDPSACKDLKYAIKYSVREDDINALKFFQKQHCGQIRRS